MEPLLLSSDLLLEGCHHPLVCLSPKNLVWLPARSKVCTLHKEKQLTLDNNEILSVHAYTENQSYKMNQARLSSSLIVCPALFAPLGEKLSGEQNQISWAFFRKVVRTNEIVRLAIISLTTITFYISTWVSVPLFETILN